MNKLISKINNISNFGLILELVDISKIGDKVNIYFELIKEKYESIILKKIEPLTLMEKEKELEETVEVLVQFFVKFYIYDKYQEYIEQNIKKLDKKIFNLIYLNHYESIKYEKLKEFIFQEILNDINNTSLDLLMKIGLFTKEQFFSDENNINIEIIYKVNEIKKFNFVNIGAFSNLMDEIYFDLEKGNIQMKIFQIFLSFNKEIIIKRLSLIKNIINNYEPNDAYQRFQKINEEKNKYTNDLISIKNSLLIYHKNVFSNDIKNIIEIIKDIEENSLENCNTLKDKGDKFIKKYKPICDEIKKVEDFLFFKIIYSNIKEIELFNDKNISIQEIYMNNKEIFDKIKIILNNNNDISANKVIDDIKNYFQINENEELIDDLNIIIKYKNYEKDIKSIIYFFKYFQINNKKWDINFIDFNIINGASSNQNFSDIKNNLNKLIQNNLYNYKQNNYYYQLFTGLYEKEEAINFLLSKINKEKEISELYNILNLIIDNKISLENIKDMEECIKLIAELRKINDNFKIYEYIKKLNREEINRFINYSKNYLSIIELGNLLNLVDEILEQINNIIINSNIIFRSDDDTYSFSDKNFKISIEELIKLKNKIPTFKIEEKEKKNSLDLKVDKLIFFKNITDNNRNNI